MGVDYQLSKNNLVSNIIKEFNVENVQNTEKFKIVHEDNELNKISIQWCKSSKILNCIRLTFDMSVYLIEFEDSYYLLTQKFQLSEISDLVYQDDFNLGILLLLFEKERFWLKVAKDYNPQEVEDIIDVIDADYKQHYFEDIKDFFGEVYVYKIAGECCFSFDEDKQDESIDRILSLMLIENYRTNPCIFLSASTLDEYERAVWDDSPFFPYNNILLSLMQNKEGNIFLELYRIIERLYPYTFIHGLKSDINQYLGEKSTGNIDIFSLHESVKKISWKHKEEDSIIKIFNDLMLTISEDINNIKAESANKDMNIGTWIYRIRNTIVHLSFKEDDKNVDLKVVFKDDKIIGWLLPLVHKMYRFYFSQ